MTRQARTNKNLVENRKEVNQWFDTLRKSGTLLIFKVKGQGHRVKFLGEGIRHALRCPCFENVFCDWQIFKEAVLLSNQRFPNNSLFYVYPTLFSSSRHFVCFEFYSSSGESHRSIRGSLKYYLREPHIYIRLKIKPNSVRIRFQSCQICIIPSTGFEPTPL